MVLMRYIPPRPVAGVCVRGLGPPWNAAGALGLEVVVLVSVCLTMPDHVRLRSTASRAAARRSALRVGQCSSL